MQHKRKKNINIQKKELLLKAIGDVIKEKRLSKEKGILLLSYEFDLPSNSLEKVEKGTRDPQITTIWKIANALDMSFGEFITNVESKLPKNFRLTED